MAYTDGKVVRRLTATDPARRIDIVVRNDGRFQFYEQFLNPDDSGGGTSPGRVSGLYESAESAERGALSVIINPAYSGMTVNERLFAAGLLNEWDRAVKARDKSRMMDILGQVELADEAEDTTDNLLANPAKYGF